MDKRRELKGRVFKTSADLEEYFNSFTKESLSPSPRSQSTSVSPRDQRFGNRLIRSGPNSPRGKQRKGIPADLSLREWLNAKRYFATKNPKVGDTLRVKEKYNILSQTNTVFYLQHLGNNNYFYDVIELDFKDRLDCTYSIFTNSDDDDFMDQCFTRLSSYNSLSSSYTSSGRKSFSSPELSPLPTTRTFS